MVLIKQCGTLLHIYLASDREVENALCGHVTINQSNHPTCQSHNLRRVPVNLKIVLKANCDRFEFLILRHAMSKNGPMSLKGSKTRNGSST